MASQSTKPPVTNPTPQELTINDLAFLCNALNPVASKCYALGLQLGVNDSRIRNIMRNNSQCEDQLREIISERLRQESPLTWHDIVRALRAESVGESRLASKIENKYIHHLSPSASVLPQANTGLVTTSSLTSALQSAASQSSLTSTSQIEISAPCPPSSQSSTIYVKAQIFIDYVKSIYKESEVERDTKVVKWPPTPSTVYINLALINRVGVSAKSREYAEITQAMVHDGNVDVIKESKAPIEFNEIAKGIFIPSTKQTGSQATSERRVILVEGAPGVGKSTFAREFCRRWERGEIAQQYQLVLLLRLRDDRISRAKSLKDLIYHPLKHVAQAVNEELLVSYNFHALIILEGFDELPDHCRNPQSIFFQLIAGKVLPHATVLVTSRPWATLEIRLNYENRIYQHIEILGFTSQQITEYIDKTLPQDKVSDMKAYLKKHPQIRMGMYIPLNSAIVVTVYQESQESGCALPTTLTELYTAMVQTLLFRYLRGNHEHKIVRIHTFNDLPPAVHTKFSALCKLAYRGIVGSRYYVQLIFTGLPSDFDSLGLMDSVTELYVTQGAVSSHNFLHLTFQEYFAAVHISTLSIAEQLKHFQRHEEGRLKVVLQFLAGLCKLRCLSHKNVHHFLIPPSIGGSSPYSMPIDAGVTTDLVNWMFEAQSSDFITLVLEKKTVEFSVSQHMLPLDSYGLGYCIAHSQCQWVLSNEQTSEDELQSNLGQTGGKVGILQPMFIENIKMVGAEATKQPGGRVVCLRRREQQSKSRMMMQRGVPSGKIVRQRRGDYAVSVEDLNMLITDWKSVLHLHELSLRQPLARDSITWPELSALRVLSLNISGKTSWRLGTLLPHLSLESLTITLSIDNQVVGLMFEDCIAIGDHITTTTCLKELRFVSRNNMNDMYRHLLTDIHVDDKGLEAITKALADNQSLRMERLVMDWDFKFTDTATDHLTHFISNTTTLQYLRIWWCTVSAHRLLQLAKAVHDNSTLQETSLEDLSCTVNGDDEVNVLARLLVHYPQVVGEYKNNIMITQFSDAGAVTLAWALHHNSTLKELDLCDKSISDAGVLAIAQALHHNSTLCWLCLSNNCISAVGTAALAEALSHNTALECLYLSNNCISDAGAAFLVARYDSTLKELDLSNNCISSVGAVIIALALYYNSTLEKLYLSNNSINDAGVAVLAQALYRNSTLKELMLCNNSIGDDGAVAIAQALHQNSTLQKLNLGGNNDIGVQGTRKLVEALTANTKLCCVTLPKEKYVREHEGGVLNCSDTTYNSKESYPNHNTIFTMICTIGNTHVKLIQESHRNDYVMEH